MGAEELLTIGQVGDELKVQSWKVRRLYERGLLPEPPRLGRNRWIARSSLSAVREALLAHGYLKPAQPVEAA
jgi:hypothetical protein